MATAVRVNATPARVPVTTTATPARTVVVNQRPTSSVLGPRKVEIVTHKSGNACLSCINTAAHVAAYALEALTFGGGALALVYLSATSVALFPPSILLVLPGAISASKLGLEVITNVFNGIHSCINSTC